MSPTRSTRRRVLQGIGAGGTVALLGGSTAVAAQEEEEEDEEVEEEEEEEEEVEDEEDDEEEFAAIRFGHLSPGAPTVDVYVGKTPDLNPTVGELSYPAFGPGPNDGYLQVPPGTYNVAVTPDGETDAALDVEEVELEAGFRYSALAIGRLDEEMEEDENGIDEDDDEVGEEDENGIDEDDDEVGEEDDENGMDDEDENGIGEEDDEVGMDDEDDEVGMDEADENDVDSETGLQPLIIADAGTMDEATPPEDQAEVSFVHASPDAGAVDIVVDGDALLEDVEFGDASDYFAVDPGEYDVAIEADGEAVLEVTPDLRAGTSITAYVTGIAAEADADDNGVDEEDDDIGVGEDDNGDTDDENGVEEDANGLDDETDEDDLPGLSVVTTLDGTNPLADGVVTR